MDVAKWTITLTSAGINPEAAQTYAEKFSSAKITLENLVMIDKDTLKELGITILGDILTILKLGKPNKIQTKTQIR